MEVGSALLKLHRRRVSAEADIDLSLDLFRLIVHWTIVEPLTTDAFDRLLDLARRHRLSAYDAAYLDLALRRGLPLATLDRALRTAAGREGVAVLPVEAGAA